MASNIEINTINATIETLQSLSCVISEDASVNCMIVTEISHTGGTPYEGTYVVDPTFEQQTLQTTDKYLADDVTVNAINVVRVSNEAGGKTVYIGG